MIGNDRSDQHSRWFAGKLWIDHMRSAPLSTSDASASTPVLDEPRLGADRLAFFRSRTGVLGLAVLLVTVLSCLLSLPWTSFEFQPVGTAVSRDASRTGATRIEHQERVGLRLPPTWWPHDAQEQRRFDALTRDRAVRMEADRLGVLPETITKSYSPGAAELAAARPFYMLGTDILGRDALARTLAGGAISLLIGLAAAAISVFIGTAYGMIAGYAGGRVDDIMMRVVDILYGLPYVLLIVLLAVASDAIIDEYASRSRAKESWIREQAVAVAVERGWSSDARSVDRLLSEDKDARRQLEAKADASGLFKTRELTPAARTRLDLLTLLIAIGGISWLTLARVIRGQVLSLKAQPFIEAARALGASKRRIFLKHLLPNLVGPIVVYATLTVPQAILQESFLSFLGIGVKPPLPSWGNLAADGLGELNTVHSNWWLLVFPCLMLGLTLLSLNMLGEGLREALDPQRSSRR